MGTRSKQRGTPRWFFPVVGVLIAGCGFLVWDGIGNRPLAKTAAAAARVPASAPLRAPARRDATRVVDFEIDDLPRSELTPRGPRPAASEVARDREEAHPGSPLPLRPEGAFHASTGALTGKARSEAQVESGDPGAPTQATMAALSRSRDRENSVAMLRQRARQSCGRFLAGITSTVSIRLMATVDGQGHVTTVNTEGAGPPGLVPCLRNAASSHVFPPGAAGEVEVPLHWVGQGE